MCALCGFLGIEHWSDTDIVAPAAPVAAADPVARRRGRRQRIAIINQVLGHYALQLDDWQACSYLLSSRTGRTEIVEDPMALWAAAEAMIGRKLDPLAPDLLARLEADSDGA